MDSAVVEYTAGNSQVRDRRARSITSGSFHSEKFAKSFGLVFDAENLRVKASVEGDKKRQILLLKECYSCFMSLGQTFASSIILSELSSVIASGFSQKTCFPLFSACSQRPSCVSVGVPTMTQSTFLSEKTLAKESSPTASAARLYRSLIDFAWDSLTSHK